MYVKRRCPYEEISEHTADALLLSLFLKGSQAEVLSHRRLSLHLRAERRLWLPHFLLPRQPFVTSLSLSVTSTLLLFLEFIHVKMSSCSSGLRWLSCTSWHQATGIVWLMLMWAYFISLANTCMWQIIILRLCPQKPCSHCDENTSCHALSWKWRFCIVQSICVLW